MKSYRVKTAEQLRNTPGVREIKGGFVGPQNTFTELMFQFCGKIIEPSPIPGIHGNTTYVGLYKNFSWNGWMLIEVTKSSNFNSLYEKLSG